MINLMPDTKRKDIEAARLNVLLVRFNIILVALLALICVIYAIFYLELTRNQSVAKENKGTSQMQTSSYSKDQSAIAEYAQNLTTAKLIFENTISYTSLITSMTELLPSGVVLDSINLQEDTIGKQTVFSAHVKTYAKASELRDRFQKSKVFSDVRLVSISDSGAADTNYPYSVTINATINRKWQQ